VVFNNLAVKARLIYTVHICSFQQAMPRHLSMGAQTSDAHRPTSFLRHLCLFSSSFHMAAAMMAPLVLVVYG